MTLNNAIQNYILKLSIVRVHIRHLESLLGSFLNIEKELYMSVIQQRFYTVGERRVNVCVGHT
jgi:hypothetical protein